MIAGRKGGNLVRCQRKRKLRDLNAIDEDNYNFRLREVYSAGAFEYVSESYWNSDSSAQHVDRPATRGMK